LEPNRLNSDERTRSVSEPSMSIDPTTIERFPDAAGIKVWLPGCALAPKVRV